MNLKDQEDAPEKMTRLARAEEMFFDVILNVDFSKIFVDDDHLMDNAKYAEISARIGMEMADFVEDYRNIVKDGRVKGLYDEEKLLEIEARYQALTEIDPIIEAKMEARRNPVANTPEGQRIMKMDFVALLGYVEKEGKMAPKENLALAQSFLGCMLRMTEYGDNIPTGQQILENNRKEVAKKYSKK